MFKLKNKDVFHKIGTLFSNFLCLRAKRNHFLTDQTWGPYKHFNAVQYTKIWPYMNFLYISGMCWDYDCWMAKMKYKRNIWYSFAFPLDWLVVNIEQYSRFSNIVRCWCHICSYHSDPVVHRKNQSKTNKKCSFIKSAAASQSNWKICNSASNILREKRANHSLLLLYHDQNWGLNW